MNVKKQPIYLDASFYIALKIKGHPAVTKRTLSLVKIFANAVVYISVLTIDEILFGLQKYGLGKETIIATLSQDFLETQNVELINFPEGFQTLKRYFRLWKKENLKPRDSAHLFLMREYGIKTIATFDKDFIQQQKDLRITCL